MKKLLALALLVSVSMLGTNAIAAIDWAGNAYPNDGHLTVPTGDQFVVAQVYKAGVTDAPGQGPDITAVIEYQTDAMVAPAQVPMAYNTDIGNNDEYLGNIPQADIAGATYIDVTVFFTDVTDGSVFEITGDQNGNPPLLRYNVSNVTPVDIEVGFRMCLSGTPTSGDVRVIGNNPALGNWSTGVVMNVDGPELYGATVIIPAGSNPLIEYKYQKDGGATWEGTPNRTIVLPTDGTATYVLPQADSWENLPLGCGLGSVLDEDKTVCFQVCMAGVDNTGGVCVIGNVAELTGWTAGVPMTHLGGDLWQACVTFPAGAPMPINVEYKFKKDDCNTWEGVPNRMVTIDNNSAFDQTLSHAWDDGPSICAPIATEPSSFSTLKSRY